MPETKRVTEMLEAAQTGDISRALELSSTLLTECDDSPYVLVWHSILIRLEDTEKLSHTLHEAEQALLRAHAVDKSYLPALEELAHYYDAISPDSLKAKAFATEYLERSRKILDEMQRIVDEAAET